MNAQQQATHDETTDRQEQDQEIETFDPYPDGDVEISDSRRRNAVRDALRNQMISMMQSHVEYDWLDSDVRKAKYIAVAQEYREHHRFENTTSDVDDPHYMGNAMKPVWWSVRYKSDDFDTPDDVDS